MRGGGASHWGASLASQAFLSSLPGDNAVELYSITRDTSLGFVSLCAQELLVSMVVMLHPLGIFLKWREGRAMLSGIGVRSPTYVDGLPESQSDSEVPQLFCFQMVSLLLLFHDHGSDTANSGYCFPLVFPCMRWPGSWSLYLKTCKRSTLCTFMFCNLSGHLLNVGYLRILPICSCLATWMYDHRERSDYFLLSIKIFL